MDSHHEDISFTHWVVPVVFFSLVFGNAVSLTPDTKRCNISVDTGTFAVTGSGRCLYFVFPLAHACCTYPDDEVSFARPRVIQESLWDQARGCPRSQHKVALKTERLKRATEWSSRVSFPFSFREMTRVISRASAQGPSGPEWAREAHISFVNFPLFVSS